MEYTKLRMSLVLDRALSLANRHPNKNVHPKKPGFIVHYFSMIQERIWLQVRKPSFADALGRRVCYIVDRDMLRENLPLTCR